MLISAYSIARLNPLEAGGQHSNKAHVTCNAGMWLVTLRHVGSGAAAGAATYRLVLLFGFSAVRKLVNFIVFGY